MATAFHRGAAGQCSMPIGSGSRPSTPAFRSSHATTVNAGRRPRSWPSSPEVERRFGISIAKGLRDVEQVLPATEMVGGTGSQKRSNEENGEIGEEKYL